MDYGDISPRTAAHVAKQFLERAIPILVSEQFAQTKPIPKNSTKSIVFRRYEALDPTPKPLTEGVTPTGSTLTKTDVTATLVQYGDFIPITDVIVDNHEDPVLNECVDILGEQAAQMMELVNFGVLSAGSTVFYANNVGGRNLVNSKVSRNDIRRVVKFLRAQKAKFITKKLMASPNYATEPVAPSYFAIAHTNLDGDIRDIPGFVEAEKYASGTPYECELGKVENCRFLTSPMLDPFLDAGGSTVAGFESNGGSAVDVYPIIVLGANAWGTVPFRGANAITPMVVNPKPTENDPLAQRGAVSWKTQKTAVILNDLFMARLEVACSE